MSPQARQCRFGCGREMQVPKHDTCRACACSARLWRDRPESALQKYRELLQFRDRRAEAFQQGVVRIGYATRKPSKRRGPQKVVPITSARSSRRRAAR